MSGGARPAIAWLLVAALFLGLGVPLLIDSGRDVWTYGWQLSRDAARTTARVTDTRNLDHGPGTKAHGRQYEVRYSFRVRADDATYRATSSSLFGRDERDEWVSVPKQLWGDALVHDRIRVEYLRSDPSVNQPVDAPRGQATAIVIALVAIMMIGFGLLFLLLAVQAIRARRRVS
jgi:hypothetical protein